MDRKHHWNFGYRAVALPLMRWLQGVWQDATRIEPAPCTLLQAAQRALPEQETLDQEALRGLTAEPRRA